MWRAIIIEPACRRGHTTPRARSVGGGHRPVGPDIPALAVAVGPVPMLERMIGITSSRRKVEFLDPTPGTRSPAFETAVGILTAATPVRPGLVHLFIGIERCRIRAYPRNVPNTRHQPARASSVHRLNMTDVSRLRHCFQAGRRKLVVTNGLCYERGRCCPPRNGRQIYYLDLLLSVPPPRGVNRIDWVVFDIDVRVPAQTTAFHDLHWVSGPESAC